MVERSLDGFKSEKEIPEEFLGITYAYFLEIVEKNAVYSNGKLHLIQAFNEKHSSIQ